MVDRRQRQGHHIQVRGRVVFKARYDHQGIAEHLVEPGPDLLGHRKRLASLYVADDLEQIRTLDLEKDDPAEAGSW